MPPLRRSRQLQLPFPKGPKQLELRLRIKPEKKINVKIMLPDGVQLSQAKEKVLFESLKKLKSKANPSPALAQLISEKERLIMLALRRKMTPTQFYDPKTLAYLTPAERSILSKYVMHYVFPRRRSKREIQTITESCLSRIDFFNRVLSGEITTVNDFHDQLRRVKMYAPDYWFEDLKNNHTILSLMSDYQSKWDHEFVNGKPAKLPLIKRYGRLYLRQLLRKEERRIKQLVEDPDF